MEITMLSDDEVLLTAQRVRNALENIDRECWERLGIDSFPTGACGLHRRLTKKPRKQPFYITRKDGLPFTFAGLWERWKDGMLSFTILTTDAGTSTHHLHDRMPVILDEAAMSLWSERGEVHIPTHLNDRVQLFPVSPRVNSPRYKEPDCIAPLTSPP